MERERIKMVNDLEKDWRERVKMPKAFDQYSDVFLEMFSNFETVEDGNLR